MNIIIKTIPHREQRYPTVGDWWFDCVEGELTLHIRVSELGDWRKEALIAYHEFKEAVLCRSRGITAAAVDAFDRGSIGRALDEPGESPLAPYHLEHMSAYASELGLMVELGVSFAEYSAAIDAL